MSFFKEVEGEAAIVVNAGVYKQVGLYTRDGYLFAKASGGFVRLMADGSTSVARMRLDFMSWTGPLAKDTFGRLCVSNKKGAKQLTGPAVQALLGSPDDPE